MRGALALTFILVASMALAGCSSGNGDGDSESSSDNISTRSGSSTTKNTITRTNTVGGNTSTLAPNLPPKLVLKVTDAGGNATNATTVGGSLTFDATGSADQDADGLAAIAIIVQDTNRTYPTAILFGGGKFSAATISFDRAGPVNVTVNGIDVRGDLATLSTKAYVNLKGTVSANELRAPAGAVPAPQIDPTTCSGPLDNPIVDSAYYDEANILVGAGAQYIVVTSIGDDALFAICDPAGTAISESSEDVATSNNAAPLAAPTGALSYYVSTYVTAPGGGVPSFEYVIHYDPRPAAAA